MGKKNKEATDFWNKVSDDQSEMADMMASQYEQEVAANKEGASAIREKMQMGITTTPKVHPSRDQK